MPPAAGAEITNCGPPSFLFTTELMKFYGKIMVTVNFLKIVTILILCLKSKKVISVISRYLVSYKTVGAKAGSAVWICGCTEPEPKEIFSAPQY